MKTTTNDDVRRVKFQRVKGKDSQVRVLTWQPGASQPVITTVYVVPIPKELEGGKASDQ